MHCTQPQISSLLCPALLILFLFFSFSCKHKLSCRRVTHSQTSGSSPKSMLQSQSHEGHTVILLFFRVAQLAIAGEHPRLPGPPGHCARVQQQERTPSCRCGSAPFVPPGLRTRSPTLEDCARSTCWLTVGRGPFTSLCPP